METETQIPVGQVHRCGPGGSIRACHAAGPGSILGRDKFLGWGFFRGFSSPVRQMSGSFRPPRTPNIIWPSLSSSIIIHYGRQWPEMLTRPNTLNIHTYIQWDKASIINKKNIRNSCPTQGRVEGWDAMKPLYYRSVSSKGAGRPRLTHRHRGWWN